METLKLELSDGIAHLQLNRGSSNALNRVSINELKDTLTEIQKDAGVRGLILHGKQGFFSSGIDLIELYHYDEAEIRGFWFQFMELLEKFIAFNKPAIAVISGHSPAGGCLLALCCDYRIMAEGDFIIGLNEVPIGLIVPQSIFDLYSFWVGRARAYQYLLEGALLNPKKAFEAGLVNEVVTANQLVTSADKQMKKYLSFNGKTWQESKRNMRKSLLERFRQQPAEEIEQVLKQWWESATRVALKTIIENLTGKSIV